MLSDFLPEDPTPRAAMDEMSAPHGADDIVKSVDSAADLTLQPHVIGLVDARVHEEKSKCTNGNKLCVQCAQCGRVSDEGCLGTDDFIGQWFCNECWESWDTNDECSAHSDVDSLESEVPDVLGSADMPGLACVPRISPLLFAGNQYSAASEAFDEVISTCVPLDLDGHPAEHLCTTPLPFDEEEGLESEEAAAAAARCIIAGAHAVNEALESGKITLVHCEYGQNRSGAICCAYAVLFKQWTAQDAIRYFRRCNLRDRHYLNQRPMNNKVFNGVVQQLER